MSEKMEDGAVINSEAPQLAAVLKEMKEGLDTVTSKVQALTARVKAKNFATVDGMSYLEAKHMLLLSYCQSLVYYLLRKAKGLSIESHPVVRSLVEIRLFLEKIRPIDKKLEYQIQKLTKDAANGVGLGVLNVKESGAPEKSEDLLQYRPNPDMLIGRDDTTSQNHDGVYRPPKIAPAVMEEDKMSKHERNALRREIQTVRESRKGYVKELIDDVEGRPEEVRENIGNDSRELTRYQEQWEERARQEEELFTRVPLTKEEKRAEKFLKKSRDGLFGLTDGLFDEIKTLPLEEDNDDKIMGFNSGGTFSGKPKKQKRKH